MVMPLVLLSPPVPPAIDLCTRANRRDGGE